MSDQTVYAEALIATIARAFYDDEVVCLIDVLLRDKFLRDDDMGPRLSLPAKQLRRTMQFLQDELLVKYELVDDLSSGGSQATRFWYIDYNHAVNVIRLRIYLLKNKLEEAELRARSSSMYLCPGYSKKVCNGRYTETEAQQVVDNTGLFLCQECVNLHQNNPDPPPKSSYTLELVDNTKDLKLAMDNMRRVSAQLSAKMVGNYQLRPGIYDLIQKVRGKGTQTQKGPLSNNLPSENRALGVGSKRLAGTGRTAGIKAKKLAQQAGINVSNASSSKVIHRMLTMDEEGLLLGKEDATELNFLKNARGEEIAFEVEKGGGARANLLATRNRRKSKLMDAAATRVGMNNTRKRKRKEKETKKEGLPGIPEFLLKNIDFTDVEGYISDSAIQQEDESEAESEDEEELERLKLVEDVVYHTPEERQRAFQLLYKMEIARQNSLLFGVDLEEGDIHEIQWEEG